MKRLVILRPLYILILAIAIISPAACLQAKNIDDLNQITLPVNDQTRNERNRAIRSAFQQVIVRYSGVSPGKVANQLSSNKVSASQYLQRFYYEQPEPSEDENETTSSQLNLVMVFDPVAINKLLGQIRLPQWGINRPELLIWIAIGDKHQRFLFGADHQVDIDKLISSKKDDPFFNSFNEDTSDTAVTELDSELNDVDTQEYSAEYLEKVGTEDNLLDRLNLISHKRGLPILFPLLDLQDQFALDSADVWGRFVVPIRNASSRYQPDAILAGRVELVSEGWIVDWLLMDDSASEVWQDAEVTLVESLETGLNQAVERLASRFSVVKDSTSDKQVLRIAIQDVIGITSLTGLEEYLSSLTAVSHMKLVRVKASNVEYELSLNGDINQLMQSIRLADRLVEIDVPVQSYQLDSEVRPAYYFRWNLEL